MGKLRIQQIVSKIDTSKNQKANLEALGLKKNYQIVEKNDTPAIRGMIKAVSHMVKVEEI